MAARPIPRLELVYAGLCAALAIGLLVVAAWLDPRGLPGGWVIIGFTALVSLTMMMGFPVPGAANMALDRVGQIAMILIFGPFSAALITTFAAVVQPLSNCFKKNFSPRENILRVFQNGGMLPIVVLAGGGVWSALDGPVPLTHLDAAIIGKLIVVALVMQATNDLMMNIVNFIRGTTRLTRFGDLMELSMAPLGVFTAIAYNDLALDGFLLLIFVLCLLTLLMRAFALNRSDLEQRIKRMAATTELSQAANADIHIDQLAELTYERCKRLIAFSSFHLVLYDEENNELDFVIYVSRGKRQPRRREPAGRGMLGWVIEHNRPLLIEDWATARKAIKQRGVVTGDVPAAWLGVPVTWRGSVLGALCVQNFEPHTLKQADLQLMQTFGGQVGAAIANARLFGNVQQSERNLERKVAERTESLHHANEIKAKLVTELKQRTDELELRTRELDRLSKIDDLTGLYNRRYMNQRIARELERANRFGRAMAVAMADIDHFKRINDDYSHAVGDEVLSITGRLLKLACRDIDIVSRYGGEEFVICLPETDIDGAKRVCERIRRRFAEYDWHTIDRTLSVTLSIGVAGGLCRDPETLQKQADQKLYQAKDLGRDRVCA
jgi:diguanylate cyclase (GGDEF)-like protein